MTLNTKVKKKFEEAQIITLEESKKMFANLDGMINLSNQMYTEFKCILEGWNRRKTLIGHSMAKYSRFLIIYNEYLVNLAQTQSKIKRLLEEKP